MARGFRGRCSVVGVGIAAVTLPLGSAGPVPAQDYTLPKPFVAPPGFALAPLRLGDNTAFVPRARARVRSNGRLPYLAVGCPRGCSVRLSLTLTRPRIPVARAGASTVRQIAPGVLRTFVTRLSAAQRAALRRSRTGTIRVRVKLRDATGVYRGTVNVPIRRS